MVVTRDKRVPAVHGAASISGSVCPTRLNKAGRDPLTSQGRQSKCLAAYPYRFVVRGFFGFNADLGREWLVRAEFLKPCVVPKSMKYSAKMISLVEIAGGSSLVRGFNPYLVEKDSQQPVSISSST